MEITNFTEKLNKVDGKVYVIEEVIQMPPGGVYEAPLQHDNINDITLTVYTGPKLTGIQIHSYALTIPKQMPWKRIIRINTDAETVYVCYETEGDMVEAEDVNLLQDAVVLAQCGVNDEEQRALESEKNLAEEVSKIKESVITKSEIDILDGIPPDFGGDPENPGEIIGEPISNEDIDRVLSQ